MWRERDLLMRWIKKYGIYFITSTHVVLWNSLKLVITNEEKDKIYNVIGYSKLFKL